MSLVLLERQKLFIQLMTENQEQAKRGFEILLKRQDFAKFFDHLKEAGLFSPEYAQSPYWSALEYLEEVARLAGQKNDRQLARKVMDVIRSVSGYPDGGSSANYHTYQTFAEILGLVPAATVTKEDIDLIPVWLSSKYDRGMVGHALDRGAIRSLLASDLPDDWRKACAILRHCTAIFWIDEKELGKGRKKPVSVIEDYRLKELIKHHASTFGIKAGREAAQIFRGRIYEVFGEEFGDLPTYLSRPAVDDHPQNHSWDGVVNCVVEGLRDVLLFWIDKEPESATAFVGEILKDQNEMVRRIGIYALNQRWSALNSLYSNILGPQLFDSRNIHELYHFLKDRFAEFSEPDKAATLETIRQLLPPPDHEEPDRLLKRTQRNWLSAIAGKGYETVDTWFKRLDTDQNLGRLSEHPDFHSYMETWSGPGPSPYSVQELIAFAEGGSLIERLNDFQPLNTWRGPSISALVKSLEETVGINPQRFFRLLPEFLDAKRPYQYGVINGFKRLWDMSKEKQMDLDWNFVWEGLIDFFERLLNNPEFWTEEVIQEQDLTPTRDWIPPIIAEFLRAGTKDDDKAYSPGLLTRGFSLIKILLENLETVDDPEEDAMFQAINSSKGKTIEALFSHTLRACRVSDKKHKDHVEAWDSIKPTFDAELVKCEDSNYEFSTLAAAYLANIDYISRNWLRASISKIFPKDFPANFVCAIKGLTYALATRPIYALLLEHRVLDRALRLSLKERQSRERIVERIALAYLWGDESLDSPRFSYLFESGQFEDLEDASSFLSNVQEQELTVDQIERVLCFWEKCVVWAQTLPKPPKSLLSALSRLIRYVTTFGDREVCLLMAVAPYVRDNADNFIEELDRLVEQDPAKVSSVLGKVLEAYEPDYDYKDRLKKLLIKLAESGKREDVLLYANSARKLPGFDQLFKQVERGDIA